MNELRETEIRRPDDWHLHLRDGAMLEGIARWTSADFARAIIMPNLVPPVVTTADAAAYRERIMTAVPDDHDFEPFMTLYLTGSTDPDDVEAGAKSGLVKAMKLYPAGATTNSQNGITNIEDAYPVLERMSDIGLPLLIHGEVTDPLVDIFDREAEFVDRVLIPLRARFPDLRMVMEHVTSSQGVDYVRSQDKNLAATLTTHHLIINRNAYLAGGIKPHFYCLPVAKREAHRLALVQAAISGDARFFLGTDSAPHSVDAKENACGCAGIFTAPNTLSCLAHVFENNDALDKLEGFTSLFGPAYYGVAPNEDRIRLVKSDQPVVYPRNAVTGAGPVVIFDPGFPLYWKPVPSMI